MDLSVVPYRDAEKDRVELVIGEGKAADPSISGGRYRECLRNHAAAIGGQAFDGCGEFMPAGSGGSLEALSCAACGCHRNFHRRDGGGGFPRRQLLLPPPPPAPFPAFFPHPLPLPYGQIRPNPANFEASRAGSETPPRREEEQNLASARARKRHRTRFTAEQKEKMQAFAEKLGWRIQKHDDAALQEFCVEVGVKRHVLKVWMHNNKNAAAAAKRDPATAAAAAAASQAIRV